MGLFSFFKKKESERDKALEVFIKTIAIVEKEDEITQFSIGHSLNMANSIFMKNFSSPNDFAIQTIDQKTEYFKKFAVMTEQMKESNMVAEYTGFYLFSFWILGLLANDKEFCSIVSQKMSWLSKKGGAFGDNPINGLKGEVK